MRSVRVSTESKNAISSMARHHPFSVYASQGFDPSGPPTSQGTPELGYANLAGSGK